MLQATKLGGGRPLQSPKDAQRRRQATGCRDQLLQHGCTASAAPGSTMHAKQVWVDIAYWNKALAASARRSLWEQATWLLRNTQAVPDNINYSACISACAKGSRWRLGLGLLEEMLHVRIDTDRVTGNAAINACAKGV
eukprot:TRINITY_DN64868_c0_g1_i1.p1 TRINITY_DN64868_c0_g1~~TRINITY_DN64868_c0_g1_i1.p1  ORF type:complete len:138 (-),score=22.52 TRINITY_DN64868_c0_g1_i1:3-416(-)